MQTLILNGHPDKIVTDLRAAADAVEKGQAAYLDVTSDEMDLTEIQFVTDSSEFGVDDKLFAEEG
jgi:hypothetical protein